MFIDSCFYQYLRTQNLESHGGLAFCQVIAWMSDIHDMFNSFSDFDSYSEIYL